MRDRSAGRARVGTIRRIEKKDRISSWPVCAPASRPGPSLEAAPGCTRICNLYRVKVTLQPTGRKSTFLTAAASLAGPIHANQHPCQVCVERDCLVDANCLSGEVRVY